MVKLRAKSRVEAVARMAEAMYGAAVMQLTKPVPGATYAADQGPFLPSWDEALPTVRSWYLAMAVAAIETWEELHGSPDDPEW